MCTICDNPAHHTENCPYYYDVFIYDEEEQDDEDRNHAEGS